MRAKRQPRTVTSVDAEREMSSANEMHCAPLNPYQSSHGHAQLELDACIVIDWGSAEPESMEKLKLQCGCHKLYGPSTAGVIDVTGDTAVNSSHEDAFRTMHDRAARSHETRRTTNQVPRTRGQSLRVHHPLQRKFSSNCLERARKQLKGSKTESKDNWRLGSLRTGRQPRRTA